MILNTEIFREQAKLINTFYIKGEEKSEAIYFNMDDSYCYCTRLSEDNTQAFLRFKVDGLKGMDSFHVNSKKFMSLVSSFNSLELANNFTFKHGIETFKIEYVQKKEEDYHLIDSQKFDEDLPEVFKISKSLLNSLKTATSMVDKSASEITLRIVAICNSTIVAMSDTPKPKQIYEEKLTEIVPDFLFSPLLVELLLLLGEDVEVRYSKSIVKLQTPSVEIVLPNVKDDFFTMFGGSQEEDFIAKYNHETKIVIDKEPLEELISFFMPFIQDALNPVVLLTVEENTLKFSIGEDNCTLGYSDRIIKYLSYEECSYDGEPVVLNLNQLFKNLKVLEGDKIHIQLMSDNPRINIHADNNNHIIFLKIKID